ncbi:MAG: hypothetical protein FWD59_01960 [Micrococcales bacterium]|nr:hypothetical protein [Micrococcales bacterium]
MPQEHGEVIVYRREGASEVQLRAVGGTVWLSQRAMADLYATTVTNVNHIIARALEDGEVTEATIDSESIVRQGGRLEVPRPTCASGLQVRLGRSGEGSGATINSELRVHRNGGES